MGKFNIHKSARASWALKNTLGFTLVELLVVIAMLSVLVGFLFFILNPLGQLEKARDGQREQGLKQINNALDSYYNDNNSYPTSLVFGSNWQAGSMIYMLEVPQDPDCNSGGSCFTYLTDSSNPQWNVLFAKVFNQPNSSTSCPLANLNSCLPGNYAASGYNYCVLSGKVDCSFISTQSLPPNAGAGTGGNGGGGGGGGGGGPTPTPIIPPVHCSTYYALTGSGPNGPLCNNLSGDPGSQCTIHGGTYTCYSISDCSQPYCQ